MRAYELSLATGEAGQFAAWHGGPHDGSSIYVQQIDGNGRLSGKPARVSDGQRLAYEPDLIFGEGQLIVAWYEKTPDTGQLSARMAGLDLHGRLLWTTPLTDQSLQTRNPVIRRIGKDVHVAWLQQSTTARESEATIWYRRFSLEGVPETPPRRIGRASWDTWNLNAAVHGKHFIITYDAAQNTAAHELHMLDVTADDVRHHLLSVDDGQPSLYPDLQINAAGQAALTWFDKRDGNEEIYLIVAPLELLGTNSMPAPRRITNDKSASIGAYAAWNGATLGLAWSDSPYGSREIFVEIFDSTGRSFGPRRAISASRGQASIPAIRPSASGFLVAWNDYTADKGDAHGTDTSSVAEFKWVPASGRPATAGASVPRRTASDTRSAPPFARPAP